MKTSTFLSRMFRLLRLAFSTFDRAIATLSCVLAFISVALTVIFIRIPGSKIPGFIVARDIAILAGLTSLSLFLLYKYARREITITTQIEFLSQQFKYSHDIVHSFRNELFKGYFQARLPEMTHAELRTLRHICDFVTNGVRESLVEYFKSIGIDLDNDISISVKLLMSPDEVIQVVLPKLSQDQKDNIRTKPHWIITVYRDHNTHMHHTEREKATKIYDVDKNSAFHHIVTSGNAYFRSNDLQSLDNYDNENPNWRQQYNSTLVVPIRYVSVDDSQAYCYGLLTVDSLNPNNHRLYDRDECQYILGHAADLLATYFLLVVSSKPADSKAQVTSGATAETANRPNPSSVSRRGDSEW